MPKSFTDTDTIVFAGTTAKNLLAKNEIQCAAAVSWVEPATISSMALGWLAPVSFIDGRLITAGAFRKSRSNMPADNLDDLITASARALDLPVDPAWHPAIRFNLDVTFRLAALVASFPLPDDAEPAPVFRA